MPVPIDVNCQTKYKTKIYNYTVLYTGTAVFPLKCFHIRNTFILLYLGLLQHTHACSILLIVPFPCYALKFILIRLALLLVCLLDCVGLDLCLCNTLTMCVVGSQAVLRPAESGSVPRGTCQKAGWGGERTSGQTRTRARPAASTDDEGASTCITATIWALELRSADVVVRPRP